MGRLGVSSGGLRRLLGAVAIVVFILFAQTAAFAQTPAPTPTLNSGDTAWMLTSMALVLFMTIPGLSLFYGGLVRTKNVLSVLMQCFAITALITVLWVIYGYSLAFSTQGMVKGVVNLNSFIGGLDKIFMKGIDANSLTLTVPETVFSCFQLTFAIITPALIIGAFAERMKFSSMLVFIALWFTFVYAPICHMVWAGDGSYLGGNWGALDFAGGTVVHINAGIAALMACIVMGKRKGYPETSMAPHNMTMTVTGAGMLWVGWFGFNAGSAVAANGSAGMAMLVTQTATAMAALTWMGIEWMKHGKPSALGAATGAVAGLVAITPASGSVGPMGALAIGIAVSVICFVASTTIKKAVGYDDSLDAFGVHGVGGTVGAIMTGIFASKVYGGQLDINVVEQLGKQLIAVAVTFIYGGIASFILLKAVDLTMGLRVTEAQESEGLDLALHGEAGYNHT